MKIKTIFPLFVSLSFFLIQVAAERTNQEIEKSIVNSEIAAVKITTIVETTTQELKNTYQVTAEDLAQGADTPGSSTPLVRFETNAEWQKYLEQNQWKFDAANQVKLKSASVEKSTFLDGPETVNDDMRFSHDWMRWAVDDPQFMEWKSYITDRMDNPALPGEVMSSNDHPPRLSGNQDFTHEEGQQMWRLFKEWCSTRNAEAKEYQYQCKFALLVTPQAYQQLQEENPKVDDPAEWRDVYGFPVLDHIRREFDILERTGASSGYDIHIEMIPEFIIIDDPLADEIDQPLPEGKLDRVNERLRDEIVEAGLNDPTSKIYQQAARVAAEHGIPVEQLKTVIIARWGQSAGASYFNQSDAEDTGGISRAFGINMHSIGGYDYVGQQDGLFATEFFKSWTHSSSAVARGNSSIDTRTADIRAANGMDEHWYPLKVEGQNEDEAVRLNFRKNCLSIVTCVSSNVGGAKLQRFSDPNKTESIVFKHDQTGEERVVEIVTGSEFHDVANMNNWQQFLMMGTSREVGLVPQDVAVNLEPGGAQSVEGVTVTETSSGHQITLPSSAVLTEVNPEISTFLVNPAALPKGVQVVTQDGTNTTLLISPEALQTITDGGNSNLDFPVQGFSPDDDNFCTASTVMRLTLEGLTVDVVEQVILSKIKLYPVPCTDRITIEGIDNPSRKEILCIIYNMHGQEVHSKSTHDPGIFNVLTSNIPAGTYLLQIRQEEKPLVAKRFVKR